LTASQKKIVKAMKVANAMKKAASKEDVSESEDDEASEDDDSEDEGSATPPAEVKKKPSAAVMRKPSYADQLPRGTQFGGLPSSDQFGDLPSVPTMYHGWYSSIWDPELFDAQVPHLDDIIQVCVKNSQGKDCAGVTARVDFLEPIDELGVVAVLRYVDGNENYMADWAKKFMKGGDDPSSGLVHFCREEPCTFRSTNKNVVHTTRWKLLPPCPPHHERPPSGVALFGGPRSSSMNAVDEARRESGLGSGGADRPGNARRSAGPALSAGTAHAQPRLPFPPLPPPSRVDAHDAPPVLGGNAARPRRVSMDDALRRRAFKSQPNCGPDGEAFPEEEPPERKRRRGRRRDRSHSSESSSAPVFRGAPTIFKGSKFLQAATKKEGALLENGVQTMRKVLAARQGGGEMTGELTEQLNQLQGVVTSYLTVGLSPSAASQGKSLGMRNEREMRTLAEGIDALLAGDLGRAGDILMQRFRACETNVLEGDWSLAKHLELIPPHQISSVPMGMRQEMVREQNLANKLVSSTNQGKRRGDDRSQG